MNYKLVFNFNQIVSLQNKLPLMSKIFGIVLQCNMNHQSIIRISQNLTVWNSHETAVNTFQKLQWSIAQFFECVIWRKDAFGFWLLEQITSVFRI